jgi:hypothetical protein
VLLCYINKFGIEDRLHNPQGRQRNADIELIYSKIYAATIGDHTLK